MSRKLTDVFERYAHEYDLITNADGRRKFHAREVAGLVKRFAPQTALDAGCANGLTSSLLAEQGVITVGLDRSRRMLAEAKKRYDRSKLPVSFRWGRFERLPKALDSHFDMVVCLANSISGVGSLAGLEKSLAGFFRILRPGGHLVVQMLNIDSFAEEDLAPIKVTENKGIVYQRFRERRGRSNMIYVSRADLNTKPPQLEVFRHVVDSFDVDAMSRRFKAARFVRILKFGDLLLTKPFGMKCRDLVLIGQRPGA